MGCAFIKLADGTGLKDVPEDWALRYFAGNTPSSVTEWPLEKGTRKGDGRFFVGNATPGTTTFVALVDGKEIGRTEMVIFPRSVASTSVGPEGNKTPANLFLAGIYIDAPAGAKNPTPANCQPNGCGPISTLPAHRPLEIFHRSTFPVVALYQTVSLVASPLRSPTPAGTQPAGCAPNPMLAIQCGGTGLCIANPVIPFRKFATSVAAPLTKSML